MPRGISIQDKTSGVHSAISRSIGSDDPYLFPGLGYSRNFRDNKQEICSSIKEKFSNAY